MRKNFIVFTSIFFVSISNLFSQEKIPEYGIKFSGFVKNDFFYDTRQTVNIREGHFLLYPAGESLDAEKKDINSQPNLNFLSIQTRLTGTISTPDAFDAKVRGIIEADFFGNENANFVDANGFRLRHAYVRLNWTNTELLVGQFWHPLFIPGCFSDVISFNTGAPFQPFSRNPQIRITQKMDNFRLIGVIATQRDFSSPLGSTSLRNAVLPDFHAQLQYEMTNDATKSGFLAGAGFGYKALMPLLFTEKGVNKYSTTETVSGISMTGFAKVQTKDFTVKVQGVYGQNLFDMTMLGGYAVKSISDSLRNTVEYTPLNTLSIWSEFMTFGESVQFGLWGGYTQNLGADDPIIYYSNKVNGTDATIRGGDIKSILRLSPRILFLSGKFVFAIETEYTSAAYADKDNTGKLYRDTKGVITQSKNISNLRILFSTILKF